MTRPKLPGSAYRVRRGVGQARFGPLNPHTKLAPTDVLEIAASDDLSPSLVAEAYEVDESTVRAIWTGKSWGWLTGRVA